MTYGDIYKLQDEKVIEKKSGTRIFPLRAVALLIFSLDGVVADWKCPRFKGLEFERYAAEFETPPAGKEVLRPINPDWEMALVKRGSN